VLLFPSSVMAACHSNYEPLSRWGHVAVAVGSKLHMWQGWSFRKDIKELASTVEQFDITTEHWEQKSVYSTPPPGLYNTANAVVGTSLYSFGGYDGKHFSNSLHKLDLHTLQWKDLVVRNPSSGPQKKVGVSCVKNEICWNSLHNSDNFISHSVECELTGTRERVAGQV